MGTFENFKSYKATGYVLLIAGLILIIWAVYSMYNVYTGASQPPSVIQMNGVTLSMPTGQGTPPAEAELISAQNSSKLVNMGIWYALMFFVASAGARIGGLGVNLIREIKVDVKK